jgi:hypothetical protein
LPGSGLSYISQTSWKSTGGAKARAKQNQQAHELADAAMNGMTKAQQRELFTKVVNASSLAEVKAQRDAFEARMVATLLKSKGPTKPRSPKPGEFMPAPSLPRKLRELAPSHVSVSPCWRYVVLVPSF